MSAGKKDDPRKARLAEALRANLRKRRDQARRRAGDPAPAAPGQETGQETGQEAGQETGQASKTPQSPGNAPRES